MREGDFALRPEVVGAGLVALAGLTLVSFAAGDGIAPEWARFLLRLFGLGYYLVWIALGYTGVWLIRRYGMETRTERWEKPAGVLVLLALAVTLSELLLPGEGGGLIGGAIVVLAGELGAWVSLPVGLAGAVVLLGPWSLRDTLRLFDVWDDWREARKEQQRLRQIPVNQPAKRKATQPRAATPLLMKNNTPPRWQLPSAAILNRVAPVVVDQAGVRQRARQIETILRDLGVEATVKEINRGPAVTQFAVEPGAGKNGRKVPLKRLAGLSDDLALGLSAAPVRIEAPIPNRPFVGIEVPNRTRQPVALRDLLEAQAYLPERLDVPLGRGADGEAVTINLADQPHLLIAGATGAGKSVSLNTLIAALLFRHTPDTLRLLLVDPKQVEMTAYDGIPHLWAPVATALDAALGELGRAVREMERRYKLLSETGARNISVYNGKAEEKLPFIVIVIDELADLVMVSTEIEPLIVRLAQKARAVGIHLVVATQRPSTDVITGLLKANFPARIAFAVSSGADSRVILDRVGAEKLLGRGDMLYQSPNAAETRRLQGVFVSDKEVGKLVKFWKRQ